MSRNRLGETASPYLRQHAENPVHWWPWTEDAFAEAAARNVPVHLSIGYAACHWCHVMADESFSDHETAAYLNDHFVNIKVDREERPDVDQIYMKALHGLGEQGGWPLTMFLSPEGEPFWGGTYFPPEPRWGRPSFRQVLMGISAAWQRGDDSVSSNRKALVRHLSDGGAKGTALPDPSVLDQSAERILSIWDHDLGGIRGAPKFPMSPVLDLLWRASLRTPDPGGREAVLTTLRALCSGGIYDHLAGGFARYSVDDRWLVPHFEKMLSDNGQLLSLLVRAWAATGEPLFRRRIEETAAWLIRDMQLPEGGFAASLDADTEHEEGLTYVWTRSEIDAVLGPDSDFFCDIYDVDPGGNWEGSSVLNRLTAGKAFLDADDEDRLQALRARLLAVRDHRPQPARDTKVLADWNGVTITALADAFVATGTADYLEAAEKAFRFICGSMQQDNRLCHSWCDGRITSAGLATDHAQMIRAAITLYAATGGAEFLQQAESWFQALNDNYIDSSSLYLTSADNGLIVRPVAVQDEAMPSAAGVTVQVAMQLFSLTGDSGYYSTAQQVLTITSEGIMRDIIGSASLQSGFDTMLRSRLAYLTHGADDAMSALCGAALAEADPALVLLRDPANGTPAPKSVPVPESGGEARLYLCQATGCRPPVADADALQTLLQQTRPGEAHRSGTAIRNH